MEKYELSFGQRALYFLQKLDKNNTAYNVGLSFKCIEKIDIPVLCNAIDKLLEKHDGLNVRIVNENGKLYQVVNKFPQYDFKVIDITCMSKEAVEERIKTDYKLPWKGTEEYFNTQYCISSCIFQEYW